MTTRQRITDILATLLMFGGLAWFLVNQNIISPAVVARLLSGRASDPPIGKDSIRAFPTFTPATVKTRTVMTPTSPNATPLEESLAIRKPTKQPAGQGEVPLILPKVLAILEVNPRAGLVSRTDFFTSACFGERANPLQDQDYIRTGDWAGATRDKCVFGYNVSVADRMPGGRYKVFGGPDGQPRFYLIPPDAFAKDERIRQLSEMQLILDPEQGCASLGSIGVTADGINYQRDACSFLSAGGAMASADGLRSIVLPINKNNILDPKNNGGNYGFLGFPAVIFKSGFSLYFTGKDGYAPPRTYFETAVDTFLPNVRVKTTAEMTNQEVKDIADQFDHLLSGTDPKSELAALEVEAQPTTSPKVVVKPRQEVVLDFTAKPGQALSSISWELRPLNNNANRQLLETNLSLDVNGREYTFTGVEDFAHCAFYIPCITGYSGLFPTSNDGFITMRYFPVAPVISDGMVTIRVQAPDNGTTLEMRIVVRVRDVDPTLVSQ